MSDVVRMPPQFTSAERAFLWVFTMRQTIILAIGALVAGAVAIYLPLGLSLLQSAILGIVIFLFFFIGGLGKYKDTPLLIFLGAVLMYKIKEKKYVKIIDEKKISKYPPTQNWLQLSNIIEDIAKSKNNDGYITMLKVKPIDLDLRTEEARDTIYSRLATMYNTIDFPIQIIINPVEYDPTPYNQSWKEKLKQYPEDSIEYQSIRDHLDSFNSTIKRTGLITKHFYVCILARASQVAQPLLKQQKEDLSVESSAAEKQKIRNEYAAKIHTKMANELRSRRSTVAGAIMNIDENMVAEELSGDVLIKTLNECYAGGNINV